VGEPTVTYPADRPAPIGADEAVAPGRGLGQTAEARAISISQSGRVVAATAGIAVLAAAILFGGLGRYPLWEPDEARHAEIAREVSAGSWMLPTLHGRPYHDKPILYYWLTAAAYRAGEQGTVAARAVSATSALLTVLAVFAWALTTWGLRPAVYSALTLLTTIEFFVLGRFGDLNMLLTLFVTIGALGTYDWTRRGGHGSGLILAAIAAALGTLTKGPVAPVLIGIVGLIQLWRIRSPRLLLRRQVLVATLVFFAIAMPWYVVAGLRSPGYVHDFLFQHHLHRAMGGPRLHPQPFYFTIVATILCFVPWALLLPAALHRALREGQDDATAFCAAWAASVVLLFSIPSGKLVTYVLPAMPPLALLVGHYCSRLAVAAPDVREGGLLRFGLGVLAASAITAPPIAIAVTAYLGEQTWLPIAVSSLVLWIFGAATVWVALERRYEWAPVVIVVAMLTVSAVFYGYGAPQVSAVISDAPIAQTIRVADPDRRAPVVAFRTYGGSLPFYLDRPVRLLSSQRRLRRLFARRPLVFIVTHRRHLRAFRRMQPLFVWRDARHILLATQPRYPAQSRIEIDPRNPGSSRSSARVEKR